MAKISKARHRRVSRELKLTPYGSLSSYLGVSGKVGKLKKTTSSLDKKDWKDVTCAVCLEFPHNAVLLLCASYDKGCRPYMCGTSYRHSNCLDRFKKANTKAMSETYEPLEDNPSAFCCKKSSAVVLACPLCRGPVKGYTVVDAARHYLNKKKRSCVQGDCAFTGCYKDLRKHLRRVHPSAKPRKVDPEMEEKWRMLEDQRERADAISTVRSSMPGSVVWGDYVIENVTDSEEEGNGTHRRFPLYRPWDYLFPLDGYNSEDDLDDTLYCLGNAPLRRHHRRRRRRHRHWPLNALHRGHRGSPFT